MKKSISLLISTIMVLSFSTSTIASAASAIDTKESKPRGIIVRAPGSGGSGETLLNQTTAHQNISDTRPYKVAALASAAVGKCLARIGCPQHVQVFVGGVVASFITSLGADANNITIYSWLYQRADGSKYVRTMVEAFDADGKYINTYHYETNI